MGMLRTRSGRAQRAHTAGEDPDKRPIPLDSVNLLAGIAPGLELEPTVAGDGPMPSSAPISVDEAGRLLRCSEATVRRLIRTAVLRPVGVGEHHVRRSDVESYRQSLLRRVPGKPGD
jgi:excisionase family DNA binding protein